MLTETLLKPIGKGQITIPLARRKLLGIDKKYVKAKLENNRIVIEPLSQNTLERDTKKIQLNQLNKKTIQAIKESEKEYKSWNQDAFLSFDEVFGDV